MGKIELMEIGCFLVESRPNLMAYLYSLALQQLHSRWLLQGYVVKLLDFDVFQVISVMMISTGLLRLSCLSIGR